MGVDTSNEKDTAEAVPSLNFPIVLFLVILRINSANSYRGLSCGIEKD
jgi:hypothetical protein